MTASKRKKTKNTPEPLYEIREDLLVRYQLCPVCKMPMGDMPGMRDATCKNCGYKDPCCE